MDQPVFSLCHTTARLPQGWRKAAQAWYDNCDFPERVEHILTADEPLYVRGALYSFLDRPSIDAGKQIFKKTLIGLNGGPKTPVAGWNLAGKISTGKFLITVADDWFPCPHWDTELLKVIPDLEGEYVVKVNCGGNHSLLTFNLETRAYFDRTGYFFYPEFIGVYGDNDFTDVVNRDHAQAIEQGKPGILVNAMGLEFPHLHPTYGLAEADEIHKRQGRPESWRLGRQVYRKRLAERGFRMLDSIAMCLPGEWFSAAWLNSLLQLLGAAKTTYQLLPAQCYSSNVYLTRATLAQCVIETMASCDYVLWIDDDNLVTARQLEMLLEDLRSDPAIDMVAGWCWVEGDVYSRPAGSGGARISCGRFHRDTAKCTPIEIEDFLKADEDLQEVDFTGFPVVLMRHDTLIKAGRHPFAAILSDDFAYGMSGEDTSFCRKLKNAGGRIFVDRRVKVPHLKLRAAEPLLATPVTVEEGKFEQPKETVIA